MLAACRTKNVRNLFCFEQSECSYRSQATFDSRYFVDISECFEKKVEATKACKSHITPGHIEAVRGLAWGAECAKAFEPIFTIWGQKLLDLSRFRRSSEYILLWLPTVNAISVCSREYA